MSKGFHKLTKNELTIKHTIKRIAFQ